MEGQLINLFSTCPDEYLISELRMSSQWGGSLEGRRSVCLTEADRRKCSAYVLVILMIRDQEDEMKTVDKHFFVVFFKFGRELINCPGIINWLNCLQQLISGNVAPSANSMS